MSEGYHFALKELADVEGEREEDEWADVADESVLVRGGVLLSPVVVKWMVDGHVSFHGHT